jgi:hypothetical protein
MSVLANSLIYASQRHPNLKANKKQTQFASTTRLRITARHKNRNPQSQSAKDAALKPGRKPYTHYV